MNDFSGTRVMLISKTNFKFEWRLDGLDAGLEFELEIQMA